MNNLQDIRQLFGVESEFNYASFVYGCLIFIYKTTHSFLCITPSSDLYPSKELH